MFYLGTIVAATTTTKDNTNTAAPFVIPAGTSRLGVQVDAVGGFIGFIASGGGALTAATARELATAKEFVVIDLKSKSSASILALNNPTGGTLNLKVFRLL